MAKKEEIKENNTLVTREHGDNRKTASMQACEVQSLTGGHFIDCEEAQMSDNMMLKRRRKIGGGQITIGNRRLWSSAEEIDKMKKRTRGKQSVVGKRSAQYHGGKQQRVPPLSGWTRGKEAKCGT